ncbi:MAG: DUF1735 domain-containing protein [Bacteroidales bacterium]|nr:DUF1735 domain-containing protein [Bacteroidales bacterium]MDE6146617.1 DUF1735 domain-containing protein [Bacteroidales bacterium]
MKKIIGILSIFVAGVLMAVSCEDNRLDGMCDDQVYFVNGGTERIVNVSVRDYADVAFTVYKSGIGQVAASVDVVVDEELLARLNAENGTDYKLLDENCYTIEKSHFEFAAEDVSFLSNIEFDGQAINVFQGLAKKEHALPLSLRSTGKVSEKLGYLLLVPVLEK